MASRCRNTSSEIPASRLKKARSDSCEPFSAATRQALQPLLELVGSGQARLPPRTCLMETNAMRYYLTVQSLVIQTKLEKVAKWVKRIGRRDRTLAIASAC